MLDSKIEQKLVFKILPKTHGQLTFTGLEYRLTTPDVDNCEIIDLKQEFCIRGPRLTKTAQHKKSVMYADDKRKELFAYMYLKLFHRDIANNTTITVFTISSKD